MLQCGKGVAPCHAPHDHASKLPSDLLWHTGNLRGWFSWFSRHGRRCVMLRGCSGLIESPRKGCPSGTGRSVLGCVGKIYETRVRFPSPAPFKGVRQTETKLDKASHYQWFHVVQPLYSLRQHAPRFDPLRLKSVRVFVYGPATGAVP